MEQTHHVKLLSDIPSVDVVIKMGCEVSCPILLSKHEEDWGLEEPIGKSDDEFKQVIEQIEKKVKELSVRLRYNYKDKGYC